MKLGLYYIHIQIFMNLPTTGKILMQATVIYQEMPELARERQIHVYKKI